MLFELIAINLLETGYTIHRDSLPEILGNCLWDQSHTASPLEYALAGTGRNDQRVLNADVRSDEISWIDSSTITGESWIKWVASLQKFLNRKLFLGLNSFESHYALYKPGCFYQRHQDAFQGDSNRLLSLIVYLNREWVPSDAGQLVLFTGDTPAAQQVVNPEFGTLVIFLSEEIEHEVLATTKDRHSIAGWFHSNHGASNQNTPH